MILSFVPVVDKPFFRARVLNWDNVSDSYEMGMIRL